MKRTLKALGLALAAAATLCACSSCYWKGCDGIDERGLKTQGYFHFYEYEDHVKIRNFSAAGKELEICYVPAQLNGKDVTAVGYQIWISADCRLQSETLKYLNLPYCVREITDFCEVPLLETLVFSSTSPVFFPGNFPTDFLSVERVKIYVPRGCTAAYQSRNDGFDFCEANITYRFNYDSAPNDGIYLADFREAGSALFEPSEPVRAGFLFGGWYTDSDCTSAWDFNRAMPESGEAGFSLFARWEPLG